MDDKMVVVKIIETIKENPILYDSTQPARNHLKEPIWQEIANMYNVDDSSEPFDVMKPRRQIQTYLQKIQKQIFPIHVLKIKWKNLRDCYRKHIRAQTEDSKAVASYKYWQWSAYLDFLRPHMLGTNTEMIYSEEYDDVTNFEEDALITADINFEDHTNSDSDHETIEFLPQQPKSLKRRQKHSERQQINYPIPKDHNEAGDGVDNRTDINDFDGTELIFLGYAKTIKKMPLKRQISVKLKIAKIMMEEEMKCLES